MEIQKEKFEWMVKPTPQRAWIEGRGLFLWLAFFFGIGAGLYLVSLYFDSLWGMFIGWLIVIFCKGGAHIAFLGRPLRAWRAWRKPGSSWIARGIIFVIFFFVTGAIQLALTYWQPDTVAEVVFKVLAGISAFMIAIYTGFALSYVRAVPFWNSSLLPVLFVQCAILGGGGLALAIGLTGDTKIIIEDLEWGIRGLLTSGAIMLLIYLWSIGYGASGSKQAVMTLLRGPKTFSLPFWVGLIFIGIVVPLIIAWYSAVNEVATAWLFLGIACELVGGLSLRYSILRGGIYTTLIPI
ncbi:DmsC/YnfH family molybdoenzyme membrane anchor subunit [Chloroflexota bacterium]